MLFLNDKIKSSITIRITIMRQLLNELIQELEQKNPAIFSLDKEQSIYPSYSITKDDLYYHISEGIHEQIMVDLDTDSASSLIKRPLLEKIKESANSEKAAGTLTEESKDLYLTLFKEIKSLDYEKFSDIQYGQEDGQELTKIEQAILRNVTKFLKHHVANENPLFDPRSTHTEQFKILGQFHLYETKAIKNTIQDHDNMPTLHDIKEQRLFAKEIEAAKNVHGPKGDMIATLFLLKTEQPQIFKQITSSYAQLAPNDEKSKIIREMINCSNDITHSESIVQVTRAITDTLLDRKGLPKTPKENEDPVKFYQKHMEVFSQWINKVCNQGLITNDESKSLIRTLKQELDGVKTLKAIHEEADNFEKTQSFSKKLR